MRYDLLIKGGTVTDPGAGYNGVMDIAVKRNRIVAVEPDIPSHAAFRVIDATGYHVTPGLIDLHSHIYENGTYFSINADAIGAQSGVTTWVDAGSVGAVTLNGFREHVTKRSDANMYAFLNIAYTGLVGQDYELTVPEYCNVEILERVVNRNRDIVAGIKIRAGRSGGANGLVPFYNARRAADELEIPIMVHISTAPPDLETVLSFLKPGDIVTHCFTNQNMRVIDENGKILDVAKKAIENGIIMDLGHGAGSMSFETAEAMAEQGFWPHVISTDLHWLSLYGPNLIDPLKGSAFGTSDEERSLIVQVKGEGKPVFNMLTCLDKMLCIGMPWKEVIRATTTRPAEVLNLQNEIGTLKPGARADIAIFARDQGAIELRDNFGNVRKGKEKVRHVQTILNGRPWESKAVVTPPAWVQFVDQEEI